MSEASPIAFISYAQESDAHKQTVLALAERLRADGIEARIDQYISGTPAETWPRWMLNQLDEADFVLVVCTPTYYRRFRGHEEPGKGKGKGADWEGAIITQEIYDRRSQNLRFVPVLLGGGLDDAILEPLHGVTHYRLDTQAGYEALYDYLLDQAGIEPAPLGTPKRKPKATGKPLTWPTDSGNPLPAGEGRVRADLSKIPNRHDDGVFVGRDAEWDKLTEAWHNPQTRIVALIAIGGAGKTTLAGRWARALVDYDGGDRNSLPVGEGRVRGNPDSLAPTGLPTSPAMGLEAAYGWTFYSQGTDGRRQASADYFIRDALRFFGDAELAEANADAWTKGTRLAELVAAQKTLLVLDGLEPLQHPPGPLAGSLTDPGMKALLEGLARRNPGLCLITSRERLWELEPGADGPSPQWSLDQLTEEAGAQVLRRHGVVGSEAELRQAGTEVKGHALTLALMGRYLKLAYDPPDIARRDGFKFEEADNETANGHAFRVYAAYERWLAGPKQSGWQRLLEAINPFGASKSSVRVELFGQAQDRPVETRPSTSSQETAFLWQ